MLRLFRSLVLLMVLAIGASACAASGMFERRVEEKYPPVGAFVAVDGKRQHLIRQGDGPPVIMIHGASANAREYLVTLAPSLKPEPVQLLMVDRTGHGYSERARSGHDLSVQADMIAGATAPYAREPAVVVGHSFGGAVALRFALDHPQRVKAVVLLAPVTHDWGGGGVAWYNQLAASPLLGGVFSRLAPFVGPEAARSSLPGLFSPAAAPEGYADEMGVDLLFRPSVFQRNALDMTRLKPQLAEQQKRYAGLSVPVIIFSGSYDTVLKPKLHAAKLRRDAPDRVVLVRLDDEGHMPHHGKAELIANTILRLARGESVHEADFDKTDGSRK